MDRLDELRQRHLRQERILHDEVTKPPLPGQTIHRMGNGPRRAMRTHLGNSIVQCISRVTTGVQQGPGFTIESPDTRFEHGTVGAVQDSSDLESRQLAAHESVLADDLKPFVDQHCFEMRNVVGSGQEGGTFGFGLDHHVADRLPHPELGGEHGGASHGQVRDGRRPTSQPRGHAGQAHTSTPPSAARSSLIETIQACSSERTVIRTAQRQESTTG